MMKWLIVAASLLLLGPAQAQWNGCRAGFCNPVVAVSSYQGPADAAGVAPVAAFSCARAVSAAKASTSTNLCDLYASGSTTTLVGTLRATSSGFVDLSSYFNGGTQTPMAACAAATGGSCVVGKRYNQVNPGTDDQTATTTQMPVLTFSAQNGLPGITCSGSNVLLTANFTQAQPVTLAAVAKETSATAAAGILGSNTGSTIIGLTIGASASNWRITEPSGTNIDTAAAQGSFHSGIGLFSGASSSLTIDGGTATTGTLGTGGYSASPISTCRANGTTLPGVEMESLVFASSSVNVSALTTNQRSATYGYNF